jgi:hypothetical protein
MEHTNALEPARAIRRRRPVPLGSAALQARCLEIARRGVSHALSGQRRPSWRGRKVAGALRSPGTAQVEG